MSKAEINVFPSEATTQLASPSSRISMMDEPRLRQWIRILLRKYLSKYARECLAVGRETTCSPITSLIDILDRNGNSHESIIGVSSEAKLSLLKEGGNAHKVGPCSSNPDVKCEDEVEKHLNRMITLFDYKIQEETAMGDDRITYLSRILSITTTYVIIGHQEHSMMWIVKIPSPYFDERNLARKINAYQREVIFYSDILQSIKSWLEQHPIIQPALIDGVEDIVKPIELNIPQCFYAITQQESNPAMLETESYEFPSVEYTLILEDLRGRGFGKRHYGQGLTLTEAQEALREIVKVHAVTWAMSVREPEKVNKWKELLKLEDFFHIHLQMIKNGFLHVRELKRKCLQDKFRLQLLDSLLNIEPRLEQTLRQLAKPAKEGISALVHMDYWTDNLVFKENVGDEDASSASSDSSDSADIDCMILDWQIVSWGRISHDLGVLLTTSLDSDIRREAAPQLIRFYYDTFLKILNEFKMEMPFEMDELINQCRESCLYAVLLAVGRFDLVASEASTLNRFFDALQDLTVDNLL